MKKIVLTTAVLFCVVLSSAQTFGAKGGANFANVSQEGLTGNSMKIGFHIGGFAKLELMEKLFLQPELLYSMQGFNYKQTYTGGTYEGNYTYHYLNIPVMAKYYVIDKLSIEAGPQLGILMSANVATEQTGRADATEDIKSEMNTIDFALGFGAGYDITEKIGVGLRYNLGLTDIYKTAEGDTNHKSTTNNVFMVSLSYAFGGK